MNKKIVIAVDKSIQAKQAVTYAAALSELVKPLTVTLHHVQPQISQYLVDEAKKNPKAFAQLKALHEKNSAAAAKLLDQTKESMIIKGFEADRIQIVNRQRRASLDRDLLDYAQENLFDALVFGHRNLSTFQKTFMDSVCSRALEKPASIPIWLVKGEVNQPEKILVAVDGSHAAYRAVDHLAFMIAKNEAIKLTLLHVKPKLKDVCTIDFNDTPIEELEAVISESDNQCMDQFFQQALKRLKESGIREDRISVNVVEPVFRIGRVILNEVEKEDFGTVVVGRRGLGRSFVTGSVSSYLIDRLSYLALFIVQ